MCPDAPYFVILHKFVTQWVNQTICQGILLPIKCQHILNCAILVNTILLVRDSREECYTFSNVKYNESLFIPDFQKNKLILYHYLIWLSNQPTKSALSLATNQQPNLNLQPNLQYPYSGKSTLNRRHNEACSFD